MYSKINYTAVGFFVMIFMVGVVWFGFWLAGYGLQQEYDYYRVEMNESISGLSKDSVVKLHGVDVGSVSAIGINPHNIETVELVLALDHGTPIREDMVIFTEMYGVTGLSYLQIEGGTNRAKPLRAKAPHQLPTIPTAPSLMYKVGHKFERLSGDLSAVLGQGGKLFSTKNLENIEKILTHIEKITGAGLEDRLEDSLAQFDHTFTELEAVISDMNHSFHQSVEKFGMMQEDFAQIKSETITMLKKVTQTSRSFNRTTLGVERTLKRGDYNLRRIFEPMLIEIEILSQQLHTLSRELGQSPSDLLMKSRRRRGGPGE